MSNKLEEKAYVLVVDDDESTRRQLFWTLAEEHNVLEAGAPVEAIEQLKNGNINVLICDLHLPPNVNDISGGISVIEAARNISTSLPIIVITGSANRRAKQECLRRGIWYFFDKPFDAEEIMAIVQRVAYFPLLSSIASEKERAWEDFKGEASSAQTKETVNEKINGQPELVSSSSSPENKNLSLEQKKGQESNSAEEIIETYETICALFAHDIKSEFLHISNVVKTLEELVGDSPEIKEELDIARRSVVYSQIMVQRLLDYFSFSKPQLETVNLIRLINEVESLIRFRLPSTIDLKISLDGIMPNDNVLANFAVLISVLTELTNNAAKALTGRTGSIELKVKKKEKYIGIVIKDDGPGIPTEIKKNLFRSKIRYKNGSGLGLFLSHRAVRSLGAKLKVRTSEKSGTTFTITLPHVRALTT